MTTELDVHVPARGVLGIGGEGGNLIAGNVDLDRGLHVHSHRRSLLPTGSTGQLTGTRAAIRPVRSPATPELAPRRPPQLHGARLRREAAESFRARRASHCGTNHPARDQIVDGT